MFLKLIKYPTTCTPAAYTKVITIQIDKINVMTCKIRILML